MTLISCPCDACGNLCDIDGFHELEISEETIAILRERLWPQTAKQSEDGKSKQCKCSLQNNGNERPIVGGVTIYNMEYGKKGMRGQL